MMVGSQDGANRIQHPHWDKGPVTWILSLSIIRPFFYPCLLFVTNNFHGSTPPNVSAWERFGESNQVGSERRPAISPLVSVATFPLQRLESRGSLESAVAPPDFRLLRNVAVRSDQGCRRFWDW
jgi:hypothetical protein